MTEQNPPNDASRDASRKRIEFTDSALDPEEFAAPESYTGEPEDVQVLEITAQMFGVKVRHEPDGSITQLEDLGLMSESSDSVEIGRDEDPADNPEVATKTQGLMRNMLPVEESTTEKKKGE